MGLLARPAQLDILGVLGVIQAAQAIAINHLVKRLAVSGMDLLA
jgi:hypothetical protein